MKEQTGQYAKQLNHILSEMGSGNYDAAAAAFSALKKQVQQNAYNTGVLEPEWGIADSSFMMTDGAFDAAAAVLKHSLKYDINNYEVYYSLGLCYEQLGQAENAYYAYRFALYLSRGTADEAVIQQQFEQLCSYAGANEYQLGKSCEALVTERVQLGEYEKTHGFLGEQLYGQNRVAGRVVLTEGNMLLYMMLEIVLCEKKRMGEKALKQDNTCVRYQANPQEFLKVYEPVKLMVRRVWFGASFVQQRELNDIMDKYDISADMLVVIAKYSILQEYWQDAFARMAAILQYAHPDTAAVILQYKNWLARMSVGGALKCMTPDDSDNGACAYRLDCRTGQLVPENDAASDKTQTIPEKVQAASERTKTPKADEPEHKIAVIFCTNDALYCKECIRYLKRLTIPAGMTMEIVSVWNASGMSAGYNKAMAAVTAKYKIYIHHDTFIIRKNLLQALVDAFQEQPDMGLIGIAGATKLPADAKWWKAESEQMRMNLYQDLVLDITKSVSVYKNGTVEDAEALDGILLATQADVHWQEEWYDGWHFYDIGQCYAFRRNGYRTGVLNGGERCVMHETTTKKDPKDLYEKYCKIFISKEFR